MACACTYASCSCLFHYVGCCGDSPCRVNHIVNNHYIFVYHITDDLHRLNNIGTSTCLITEDERAVEIFCVCFGTLSAAYIRRGNHKILEIQRLEIRKQYARPIEVVNGDVKESLNLVGMKVHGYEAVYTGYTKNIGYKLRADRNTGFILAVLSCPSEIWSNCDDALC